MDLTIVVTARMSLSVNKWAVHLDDFNVRIVKYVLRIQKFVMDIMIAATIRMNRFAKISLVLHINSNVLSRVIALTWRTIVMKNLIVRIIVTNQHSHVAIEFAQLDGLDAAITRISVFIIHNCATAIMIVRVVTTNLEIDVPHVILPVISNVKTIDV